MRDRVVLERRASLSDPDPCAVVDLVVAEVSALRAEGHPVRGVGIAIGGLVADQSTVWEVPALGWCEVDLGALLRPAAPHPARSGGAAVSVRKARLRRGAAVVGVDRPAGERLGREVSFEEALELAIAGDPVVTPLVAEVAHQLGRLTALVANVVGPERILLSGDGIGSALIAPDDLHPGLRELRSGSATDDDLVVVEFEFFAWARGAATVAIRSYVLQGC